MYKLLSACRLGNGKKDHGRNENVEKSRSGQYTFLSFFSHFPGCKASGWRCSTAQPVARSAGTQFASLQSFICKSMSAWCQCRSQLAKLPSLSAKGFLRVAVAHPIRKFADFHLRKHVCVAPVAHPARKNTIFLCEGGSAWRQWRTQLAKTQSSSAKVILRGALFTGKLFAR